MFLCLFTVRSRLYRRVLVVLVACGFPDSCVSKRGFWWGRKILARSHATFIRPLIGIAQHEGSISLFQHLYLLFICLKTLRAIQRNLPCSFRVSLQKLMPRCHPNETLYDRLVIREQQIYASHESCNSKWLFERRVWVCWHGEGII
jgi:hypothetical protein